MNNMVASFISKDLERIYPHVSEKLEAIHGKSILITGGAGFLGSWLCEWLMFLNREEFAGIKVYIVDRDNKRFSERFEKEISTSQITVINSDIRGLTEIPKDVNYIIHAAATPDTRYHVSCPMDTMTTIAEGTAATLKAASRLNSLYSFLNISASAIYANRETSPLSEISPAIPFSESLAAAYAEAKRYAEKLCQAAKNEARLPIITVRPFTFCGPYQELSSPWVLNNFINDALNHRQIKIFGDGQTVRGVMYGADFAVWLLIILLNGRSGQTFNIGSDNPIQVSELAKKVSSNFSPSPAIMLNTALAKINDRTYLLPDISCAKKDFGLNIYTDLDLAISRTVSWFKQF